MSAHLSQNDLDGFRVVDLCAELQALHGGRVRSRYAHQPLTVVWHRFGETLRGWPYDVLGARDVAQAFADLPELSTRFAGNVYHFVIGESGIVEQWVPVMQMGAASRHLNSVTVDVALLGDFRKHEPTSPQLLSAQLVTYGLRAGLNLDLHGHSELGPDAYSDPHKAVGGPGWCPGELIDMDAQRAITKADASLDPALWGIRLAA